MELSDDTKIEYYLENPDYNYCTICFFAKDINGNILADHKYVPKQVDVHDEEIANVYYTITYYNSIWQ